MTRFPNDLPDIRLAPGEDVALARAVEAGVYAAHLIETEGPTSELTRVSLAGQAAAQHLWWSGARIAAHLAHQVVRSQLLPPEDVLQDAYLALSEAVIRYDHARGMRFTSFVYQCVTQALVEAYRHRPGTLPPNRVDRWAAALAKAERERQAHLGVTVTLREAAEAIGVSVTAAARGAIETVSLDHSPAADMPAEDDDAVDRIGTDFLGLLDPLHAAVLRARYGIGAPAETLAEVSARLRRAPSTVGRWERAALAAAREILSGERTTMATPRPVSRGRRSTASCAAFRVR
ncbi:MAG: sigma factor [Arachnia sp.]